MIKSFQHHFLPVILTLCPGVLFSQHQLVLDSLYSQAIGEQKYFYVLKPIDDSRNFPVLYLLHGAYGNYTDWIERTDIRKYVDSLPLIIVFPDADDSYYVNWESDPDKNYADYLLNDLLTFVEIQYPVDKSNLSIAGLSMGGYGAFYLASLKPKKFRFVGSLSGAHSVPDRRYQTTDKQPENRTVKMIVNAFGQPDSLVWSGYFPPVIASGLKKDFSPYFYFVHGIQDNLRELLPVHRELTDTLRVREIPYEYHEIPGEHNWQFWDLHIQGLLVRLMEVLNENKISQK